MKKRLVAIVMLLLFMLSGIPMAVAHDSQKEHDRDLQYALFGNEYVLRGDENLRFQAISNAAALAIDQFSSNGNVCMKQGTYDDLQSELEALHLGRLDIQMEDINLNYKIAEDGKNITANTHRLYTHMGWNYRYHNRDFWNRRKDVLLQTVNKTLFYPDSILSNIPWLSNLFCQPSEQCDAFSALIYYIHILGDHIEGNIPEKLTDLEPLIQYTSWSSPGIIVELQEQIQIVFIDQHSSWTYAALMDALDDLKSRAEKNCGTWGKIDSVEKCRVNQVYAKELLDILAEYLPQMLQRESFFSQNFKR